MTNARSYGIHAAVLVVSSMLATITLGSQAAIPVYSIAATPNVSRVPLFSVSGIKAFGNGNVLVNDPFGRQLLLLDSTLTEARIVADTGGRGIMSYGRTTSLLISHWGDSALFLDFESGSFLLMNDRGTVAQVIAPVRVDHARRMLALGAPQFAPDARLYYRQLPIVRAAPAASGELPTDTTRTTAPVLRMDFVLRTTDTVDAVEIPTQHRESVPMASGGSTVRTIVNPVIVYDDFAVLSDGSVAFVRAHDYHIDWLRSDGRRTSSKPMPFDWRRLTEADKQRLADSTRTANERTLARLASDRRPSTLLPLFDVLPVNQIRDYLPPLRIGSLRADYEAHLWIPPTTSKLAVAGQLVYDVIDTNGRVVARVRLPDGYSIAGFGPNRSVYLVIADQNGSRIMRAALPKLPR